MNKEIPKLTCVRIENNRHTKRCPLVTYLIAAFNILFALFCFSFSFILFCLDKLKSYTDGLHAKATLQLGQICFVSLQPQCLIIYAASLLVSS